MARTEEKEGEWCSDGNVEVTGHRKIGRVKLRHLAMLLYKEKKQTAGEHGKRKRVALTPNREKVEEGECNNTVSVSQWSSSVTLGSQGICKAVFH